MVTVAGAALLAVSGSVVARCVADGPIETARWIHAHQNGFDVFHTMQDAKLLRSFLSPQLYGLLEVEWRCQVIEEGLCAVDTDPWTNAQHGRVLEPVTFELASTAGLRASVTMKFRLGRSDQDASQVVAAAATLAMVKDAGSGCWQLDDVVGAQGRSLVTALQGYRFYP